MGDVVVFSFDPITAADDLWNGGRGSTGNAVRNQWRTASAAHSRYPNMGTRSSARRPTVATGWATCTAGCAPTSGRPRRLERAVTRSGARAKRG